MNPLPQIPTASFNSLTSFLPKAIVIGVHSPVAQLAEQVAVNHWVRGSNPRGGVLGRS